MVGTTMLPPSVTPLKISFSLLRASSGAELTDPPHSVSYSLVLAHVAISSLRLGSKCIRSG